MDNSIRTALGIKDTHLELDTNTKEDSIADHGDYIVVHLVQSYPMHCPHCGRLMYKNGIKIVNYHGQTFITSRLFGRLKAEVYLPSFSSMSTNSDEISSGRGCPISSPYRHEY